MAQLQLAENTFGSHTENIVNVYNFLHGHAL
jgi:hypothetical protein